MPPEIEEAQQEVPKPLESPLMPWVLIIVIALIATMVGVTLMRKKRKVVINTAEFK